MSTKSLTLLDEDDATRVNAIWDNGNVFVDSDGFARFTGWELKEEGLCKDSTCIPVRDPSELNRDGYLDLRTLAELLNRPLALETEPASACLGPSLDRVQSELESGKAPDFTLPDWKNDSKVSLSDFEGNKIFLLVWASW